MIVKILQGRTAAVFKVKGMKIKVRQLAEETDN